MIEPLILKFPMHEEFGARQIQLTDILESVEGDELAWVVKYFDAIGREDSSLNVLKLEERITNSRGEGLRFTSTELLSLAREIDQIIDCEIFGYAHTSRHGSLEPVVRVEAFDSTEWTVIVDQAVVQTSLA